MKLKKFFQKQWHIIILVTCVAIADVTLILISATLQLHPLARDYQHSTFNGYFAALAACVKSAMTLFIYLSFNPSFRSNFRKFFCEKLSCAN